MPVGSGRGVKSVGVKGRKKYFQKMCLANFAVNFSHALRNPK